VALSTLEELGFLLCPNVLHPLLGAQLASPHVKLQLVKAREACQEAAGLLSWQGGGELLLEVGVDLTHALLPPCLVIGDSVLQFHLCIVNQDLLFHLGMVVLIGKFQNLISRLSVNLRYTMLSHKGSRTALAGLAPETSKGHHPVVLDFTPGIER